MPRKKNRKPTAAKPPAAIESGPLSYHPFGSLKGLKVDSAVDQAPEPAPARPECSGDEDELFQSAMSDVIPIKGKYKRAARAGSGPAVPNTVKPLSEDLEVLAQLEDLVAGRAQFDLVDTDEYLEGFVKGIHPIILEKLRRGHFSVQAYLDLHGLTVREADEAVRDFIAEAITLKYRCVLLVHGRGLNSKDQIPVLKKRLETILLRGPVRKKILAFTSARPHDGGAGASYVLLRAKK